MDLILNDALNHIPVSQLTRAEWVSVGMALKDAGADVGVWDAWSRNDGRFHEGECERLWNGFHGSTKPVTAGSIITMAQNHGWSAENYRGRDLGWNDIIREDEDKDFVEKPLPLPVIKDTPAEQLKRFIKTLYKDDEYIDIVTSESFQDEDGKWKPKAGHAVKVGDLIRDLEHYTGDDAVENTIGDYEKQAGCWIRINPLDGKGHGNANVTAYRYTLVESDSLPREKQKQILEELKLPIATMVNSGGKSIHALVRIDAKDLEEYKTRVDYLYTYLEEHGFTVDQQNKNPSRLSRLPGVTRGVEQQALIGVDIGCVTWEAWFKVSQGKSDRLPEIIPLGFYIEHPPVLKPELIHGILRQGHKMMLQGPSKAGKSFALMEMCVAMASAQKWMGWECEKARSIYINMELDDQSCGDRFMRICNRMHVDPAKIQNDLYIWNLRGFTKTLDDLMADLIHMMRDIRPGMVVFDPIYKIMSGDENNASDMGHFVGQFDRISTELQTSIAIAHHYTKGSAGSKNAMDRSSGSGVFARDPDAIIDMAPLEMTESFLREMGDLKGKRPYRLNTILREFPGGRARDVFFDYPVHEVTEDCRDLKVVGETVSFGEYNERKSANAEAERLNKLESAWQYAESHKLKDMADFLKTSTDNVRRMCERTEGYKVVKGEVVEDKEG